MVEDCRLQDQKCNSSVVWWFDWGQLQNRFWFLYSYWCRLNASGSGCMPSDVFQFHWEWLPFTYDTCVKMQVKMQNIMASGSSPLWHQTQMPKYLGIFTSGLQGLRKVIIIKHYSPCDFWLLNKLCQNIIMIFVLVELVTIVIQVNACGCTKFLTSLPTY
jgi:hypothetical protein